MDLDLEFLGEVEEARLKKPMRNGRVLRGNVMYNKQLKEDARKKANAKRRKTRKASKTGGRGAPGKPKSAAHRKAISAGMKRYWASKASKRRKRKSTGRRKTTTRKRTTRKTTARKTSTRKTSTRKRGTSISARINRLRREGGNKRELAALVKKQKENGKRLGIKTTRSRRRTTKL